MSEFMKIQAPVVTLSAQTLAGVAPAVQAVAARMLADHGAKEARVASLAEAKALAGVVRAGYGSGKVPAGFVSPNGLAKAYAYANPSVIASLWGTCTAPENERAMRIVNNLADKICRTLENAGMVECFNPDSAGYRTALAKKEGKPKAKPAKKKSVAEAANATSDSFNKLTEFSIADMLVACAARIGGEVGAMGEEERRAVHLNAMAVATAAAPRKAVRR
jgi:hypothetical protein